MYWPYRFHIYNQSDMTNYSSLVFRCVMVTVALVHCVSPIIGTHVRPPPPPPFRNPYTYRRPTNTVQTPPHTGKTAARRTIIFGGAHVIPQPIPWRRIPLPKRRPRPPTTPSPPTIPATPEELLARQAILIFGTEEHRMKLRLHSGTDLKVADFPAIVPAILGATATELGDETEKIALRCRMFNWFGTLVRFNNLDTPVTSFMNTTSARLNGVSCPFHVPTNCGAGPYRTLDGTCNNLDNPLWGASFIPFKRLIPAQYDSGNLPDGMFRDDLSRQTGVNDQPLPSARLVSNVVHASSANPIESSVTMEYTNYGQFLSHEVTDTPMETGSDGSKVRCCQQSSMATRRCDNIVIPPVDFFRDNGRTCFGFSRTTEVTDVNCQFGQREQLNIASAFLDGTSVYGHDEEQATSLRAGGGLLKTSFPNQLPLQKHAHQGAFEQGINFLKSGDEKVSEWTGLVAITTIWHREHNRIASILAGFDRFANLPETQRDNFIFEETRKIIIAMIQHVSYKEYIPITIGPDVMSKYNLKLLDTGYFTGYNKFVDPTFINVVGTGSLRFGHSMLRNEFHLTDKNHQPSGQTLRLSKLFWRSNNYLMFENGFQSGVLTDASEVCDRHMPVDLRNHMFETSTGNGVDLASLNIQRGRDHGLPSYNSFRRFSSLVAATEWSADPVTGFKDMSPDTVAKFQNVYSDPDDVDIWSGGISEIPVPGGQVGPLFADQLGLQFESLRLGDRFWYENEQNGFTPERLAEIRKSSLARIICHNIEGVISIQPRAFERHTVGGFNDRMNCADLPDVDLQLWQ